MDCFTCTHDFVHLATEFHYCFTVQLLSIERSCHSFSASTLNIERLPATSSPNCFPFLLQVISWSGDDTPPQVPGCLSWHFYSTAKSANLFLICVPYALQLLDRRGLSLLHYSGLISSRTSDEDNFSKLLLNVPPALQAHRLSKGSRYRTSFCKTCTNSSTLFHIYSCAYWHLCYIFLTVCPAQRSAGQPFGLLVQPF